MRTGGSTDLDCSNRPVFGGDVEVLSDGKIAFAARVAKAVGVNRVVIPRASSDLTSVAV